MIRVLPALLVVFVLETGTHQPLCYFQSLELEAENIADHDEAVETEFDSAEETLVDQE